MRVAAALVTSVLLISSSAFAQTYPALDQEPACQTLMPAAAGGPLPRNPDVLVLRFLGVSNYELAYRDNVILLDAGIDKLAWWAPNNITPEEMTRHVNAILIGHAHGEHLWDAPYMADKTGALVVGDPISMRWVRGTGRVGEKKMAVVQGLGGETFTFNGFTVEAVQGHHNIVPDEYMRKDRAAAEAVGALKGGLTPDQQAHDRRLNGMVPLDAEEREKLITEGTVAYFFTFDNGFKAFYTDSAGPTTEAERKIAQTKGSIDLGFIPYYGGELAIPITMEYIRMFKPGVMLPTHHDGHRNRMLDMPMGPLNLAIRGEFPTSKAIAPLLRAPVCINTVTKELYIGTGTSQAPAPGAKAAMLQDPACQVLTPVSAGGPAPKDPETVAVRWLGWTNYEVAYRGNVFLLDAYYDRGPRMHPIGVAPADIKKANAIFIGHAHFDHMSDAAVVAKQTGAPVIGASFAGEVLTTGGVPARQFKAIKGGETMQYPGVTVEAVLGHHNVIATQVPQGFLEKQATSLDAASLQQPVTGTEQRQLDAIRARGSRDPKISTEGVINYMFTFGNGFHLLFADSPGPITDAQRALAQKVPAVDVAMLPYFDFDAGIPPLAELVKTFKPSSVFLGHHDAEGTMKWASNYPPALAIRDVSPRTRTMDVIYRTPVCFNTASKEMVVGW